MAEWLRRGLQILARRFDSGSGLHPHSPCTVSAPSGGVKRAVLPLGMLKSMRRDSPGSGLCEPLTPSVSAPCARGGFAPIPDVRSDAAEVPLSAHCGHAAGGSNATMPHTQGPA